MGPRLLFVYNPEKAGAEGAAQRGLAWCQEHGIFAMVTPRREFVGEEVNLVVAVGGDGTLLRVAAKLFPQEIPILGVHTGSLGFLAACEAAGLERALELVVAGKTVLSRRTRLAMEGREFTALNDVAVVGPADSRFTELALWANGEPLASFPGDGVILSTPTGATAYALACGGPLVHPEVPALFLVPVAPHRLGVRPVVLPQDVAVLVRTKFPAVLLVDGDRVGDLRAGEELEVRRAKTPTVLVRLPGEVPFFARAHEKLGWAKVPAGKEDRWT